VRRLRCREESLVSDAGRRERALVLAEQPVLNTVYEFKQRLIAVWAKRGGNAEELLRELRQWCADAEAPGIEALNEFVRELKSYSVPRLALNRHLETAGAIPCEVTLEMDSRFASLGGRTDRMTCRHRLHPRLLTNDAARIDDAAARSAAAEAVALAAFVERIAPPEE
jgi:hypothetical protein